jgi:hypothetical protein
VTVEGESPDNFTISKCVVDPFLYSTITDESRCDEEKEGYNCNHMRNYRNTSMHCEQKLT